MRAAAGQEVDVQDVTTTRAVPSTPDSSRSLHRSWAPVPRQLLVAVVGVVIYFGVRGRTEGNVDQAVQNARWVIDVERTLGINIEAHVQAWGRDFDVFVAVVNWIYIWGHWPVIASTLLWLVVLHPAAYVVTRNAMLLSGAFGMVVFALFPLAPPRLMDLGLLDTVTERSSSYRVLQPPGFVNQYAAMPSLHMGWDLLIGMAIVGSAGALWLRVLGGLLPMLMGWAVVATANHYVVDLVAGVLLVLVCHAVASRWAERKDRFGPRNVPMRACWQRSGTVTGRQGPSTRWARALVAGLALPEAGAWLQEQGGCHGSAGPVDRVQAGRRRCRRVGPLQGGAALGGVVRRRGGCRLADRPCLGPHRS